MSGRPSSCQNSSDLLRFDSQTSVLAVHLQSKKVHQKKFILVLDYVQFIYSIYIWFYFPLNNYFFLVKMRFPALFLSTVSDFLGRLSFCLLILFVSELLSHCFKVKTLSDFFTVINDSSLLSAYFLLECRLNVWNDSCFK